MHSIEEKIALSYIRHAEDALEILVGRNYDDIAPSQRLRLYLNKRNQTKEMERDFPEFSSTFNHLRQQYSIYAEIAIHELVEKTQHALDEKLALAIAEVRKDLAFPLAA